MTDVLAIVGAADSDEELVEEIARRRPDRVTLLLEDQTPRSTRIARLLRAIEERTGAIVVGMVASRAQLRGWRFDRIVGRGPALTA
jgi:hypothetical protein